MLKILQSCKFDQEMAKTYYNPQFLGPKLLFGQQIFLGSIFGALDLFRHKSFMPKFFRTQIFWTNIFLTQNLVHPKFILHGNILKRIFWATIFG